MILLDHCLLLLALGGKMDDCFLIDGDSQTLLVNFAFVADFYFSASHRTIADYCSPSSATSLV